MNSHKKYAGDSNKSLTLETWEPLTVVFHSYSKVQVCTASGHTIQ